MRLLIDTHALLWLLKGSPELSATAHAAIADASNEKSLSVVSLWEITIKVSLDKLRLPQPLPDFLSEIENHPNIRVLPIQSAHLLWLASLPQHHRDPFDRLIVAQTLSEKCTLVSSDGALDAYGVSRLW